jgi:hypothetical protein
MNNWLEKLAGFIVTAACDKFGLHNADDLEKLLAKIVHDELPDMAPFEALPDRILTSVNTKIDGVVGQLNGIPAQVVAQVKSWLPAIPGLPNLFGR